MNSKGKTKKAKNESYLETTTGGQQRTNVRRHIRATKNSEERRLIRQRPYPRKTPGARRPAPIGAIKAPGGQPCEVREAAITECAASTMRPLQPGPARRAPQAAYLGGRKMPEATLSARRSAPSGSWDRDTRRRLTGCWVAPARRRPRASVDQA